MQHLLRFSKARLSCEDQSEIHKSPGVFRVVLRRLSKQPFCFLIFPLLTIQDAQIALRFGVLRIERDGEFELLLGMPHLAARRVAQPEWMLGVGDASCRTR